MVYTPKPIVTTNVQLPVELQAIAEELAKNTHEVWSKRRVADGWTWGPQRDDATKKHPCLVPYEQLPESEKQYDRSTATETLKAILALGYRIEKAS